jgi:hypothetical protein
VAGIKNSINNDSNGDDKETILFSLITTKTTQVPQKSANGSLSRTTSAGTSVESGKWSKFRVSSSLRTFGTNGVSILRLYSFVQLIFANHLCRLMSSTPFFKFPNRFVISGVNKRAIKSLKKCKMGMKIFNYKKTLAWRLK